MIKTYLKYFLRRSYKYHLIKLEKEKAINSSLDYICGLLGFYYIGSIMILISLYVRFFGFFTINLNKYENPIKMAILGLIMFSPGYFVYKKYKLRMIAYLEGIDINEEEKKMSLFVDFLIAISFFIGIPALLG